MAPYSLFSAWKGETSIVSGKVGVQGVRKGFRSTVEEHVRGYQNYGLYLDPCYNTAPSI